MVAGVSFAHADNAPYGDPFKKYADPASVDGGCSDDVYR